MTGEFVERKLEVGNSWSGMNSGNLARWFILFNFMLLFRVSQNFSNGCFFFCPLSLFCLACVTEADLSENKKRFGAVHENRNTHTSAFNFVQRINNFSKFLYKKLSLCSTDFLFLPFIHVPQPESLWGVHSVDLLYLISFEGSISLAPFSGALFFSFSFFSMCLRCAGVVAVAHSSILQPIIILEHSYQCFGLTPKLLGFCFLYKMVSVLWSHQLSWQVLHTRVCSSCNTSYLVPLRQVSLSLTN